jgi:hypothetical protein
MTWLLAVAGALLLVALAYDVFETVFHPGGHGGPVFDLQTHAVWGLFRTIGAGRDGTTRNWLLCRAAPLMAPLTLVIWAAMLVLGFALVYIPWIHTFLFPAGHLRTPFLESIYYSTMAATSLGNGDMVADLDSLRMVTSVESLSGVALVSVAVSYLINIYGHQGQGDTVARKIHSTLNGRDQYLLALTDPVEVDAFARQLESMTDLLTRMMQAYEQYPILHYFRPNDASESLPVQVGRLLFLLRGLEGTALGLHPSIVPLERTVMRYLAEVNEHLVPRGFEPGGIHDATAESEARYDRVLKYLRYR